MWLRRRSGSGAPSRSLSFRVEGMHCGSCGLTIDEAVEEVVGIQRSQTSFRSGTLEVALAADASAEVVTSRVVAAVAEVGYSASPLED